jgi:hypothetical protein
MLALLALALASPQAHLADGMAAMKAKRPADAVTAYRACIAEDAAVVECHWELGWAYWVQNDWEGVVQTWTQVQRLQPSHSELPKHLPTAQGHLASLRAIKAASEGSPDTVRAPLPAGKTLRIRSVGDIMMGTDFPDNGAYLPPEDGKTVLAGVKALLADADLTFGNLEGPLCDTGETQKCADGGNCYAFRTPVRYGAFLKDAGFDVMSTANNHAEDFGLECRMATETALDALGIAHSGRPGDLASITVDGVKVGMVGFHTNPNSHFVNDHEMAAKLVAAMKQSHDLVIVSFHGGAEGSKNLHVPDQMEMFYGEERGHLRKFARVVIGAGADLVLGHGPHVPRGFELIDGHLAAYSMGNFATYGRFNLSGHLSTSLILETTLDHEGKLVSGKILPVRLEGEGIPMPDANLTAVDLIRTLSAEDFGENAPVFGRDGTFAAR